MKLLSSLLALLAVGTTLTITLPKHPRAFEITELDSSVLLDIRSLAASHGSEPQLRCTRGHSFPAKLRNPFKTVFCNATSNFQGNHYDGVTTWSIKYHINELDYGHVDPSFVVIAPLNQPNVTFTFDRCMRTFDILMNTCVNNREARIYGGTYYDGTLSWVISIMPTIHDKRDLSIGQDAESGHVSPLITSLPLKWGDLHVLRASSLFKCDPPSSRAVRREDAYKFAFELCNSTAGIQSESVIDGRQFWWWQTEYTTDAGKLWAYFIVGGPTNKTVKYRIDHCHIGMYSLFATCGDAEKPLYYPGTYSDEDGFVYFLRLVDSEPAKRAPVTSLTAASKTDTDATSNVDPRSLQAPAGIIQCDANDERTVKESSMIVPVADFCSRTAGNSNFGTAAAVYEVDSFEVQLSSIVRSNTPYVYNLEQCSISFWQILHSCQSTHFGEITVRGGTNDEFAHIWKVDIHKKAEMLVDVSPNPPRSLTNSLDKRQISDLIVCAPLDAVATEKWRLVDAAIEFCTSVDGTQTYGLWAETVYGEEERLFQFTVTGPPDATMELERCTKSFKLLREKCSKPHVPADARTGTFFDGDWVWELQMYDA